MNPVPGTFIQGCTIRGSASASFTLAPTAPTATAPSRKIRRLKIPLPAAKSRDFERLFADILNLLGPSSYTAHLAGVNRWSSVPPSDTAIEPAGRKPQPSIHSVEAAGSGRVRLLRAYACPILSVNGEMYHTLRAPGQTIAKFLLQLTFGNPLGSLARAPLNMLKRTARLP